MFSLGLHGGAYADDDFKVYSGPNCNETYYAWMSVPHGSGILTWVQVPAWKKLSDRQFKEQILDRALRLSIDDCKTRGRRASVAGIVIVNQSQNLVFAWRTPQGPWNYTLDQVQEAVAKAESQERQQAERTRQELERKAAEEKTQREKQIAEGIAIAEAAAARKKTRADFIAQNKIETWSNVQNLRTNPFPFQGKVVGIGARFSRMLSSSEALFGDMLVTNVPTSAFTQSDEPAVLAIKIGGLRSVRAPVGVDVQVPFGSFVGAYRCKQPNCADFFDPN